MLSLRGYLSLASSYTQYRSLLNMFTEGKGDLQCSQNIPTKPEKHSRSGVKHVVSMVEALANM